MEWAYKCVMQERFFDPAFTGHKSGKFCSLTKETIFIRLSTPSSRYEVYVLSLFDYQRPARDMKFMFYLYSIINAQLET